MGRGERSERDSLPPSGGALLCRRLATGGAVPSGEFGVRSAASWLTRCASCAPLPQPTPSGCLVLGVVEPPSGHRFLRRGRTVSAVCPGTLREPSWTRHDRGCGNGSQ